MKLLKSSGTLLAIVALLALTSIAVRPQGTDFAFKTLLVDEIAPPQNTLNYKALVDGVATDVISVSVASNYVSSVILTYYIEVKSAVPQIQNHTGIVNLMAINNAGVIACNQADFNESNLLSVGTLVDTWSSTAGVGLCKFSVNANTSMTPTSMVIKYTPINLSTSVITRH